ncbi:hypothetical protein N7454_011240 [Penicillium verhagenii]|nr:hypothetical protein N7454_011240 [Penicillium verhagenii]
MMSKTIALIASMAVATIANPTITYAGYFDDACSTTTVDLASAYAGACVNIEDFPILSFSAVIASGSCADGTSAVLNTYLASGCDTADLSQTVSVTDVKQCFAADVTLVSISAECV